MNTYPIKKSKFVRNLSLAIGCGFACVAAVGCSPTKPIYLNETGDLSYYIDKATAVEYPDADIPSLEEVTQSQSPFTVIDSNFNNFEDLTLEDVVSMGLQNSKIIRGYGTPSLTGTRVSPGVDNLSNGVEAAASIYSVAIRESEPGVIATPGAIASPSNLLTNTALDSNQGVESALAEFDAAFTSSVGLAISDEPRNGSSFLNSEFFVQKQATWQSEISKKTANGTQLFFRNINQYTENNNPLFADGGIQALDSFYRTSLEAEIRQPLLRGRGTFINRAPIVISRINTDQEIANLESTLQNMVANLEIRYWDLYLAYRSFEAAKTGRHASLETWRIIQNQYKEGAEVNIQNLAQASEQYHFFDAQVIDAYNNLLNAEGQLRFLLGWSSTDGRFIRPIDDPVKAPVEFNWVETLCEALTYRPEVRRRRWEIKKRELALQYSKNGLLPQLDVSFVYRWLGLGNRFGTNSDVNGPFPLETSGALNELYGGDAQELSINGTFAAPIGFRREEANVRNAQLKLAREIARGEDLELDITKELSETMRALAANQMIMRSAFNRWISTDEEVDHFERLEEAGVESLDVSLDATRRRAQSEVAFYTAVVEYNKTIALMHHRKGTILAYSGVEFQEGPWAGKAYIDAQEHARRRGASREINYGWTRPQVVSRGANNPSNHNTGFIAPAPTLPAGHETPGYLGTSYSDPNGVVPLDAVPFNGQEVQPYYEEPINSTPFDDGYQVQPVPGGIVPQLNSLTNNHHSQGRSTVQQVSYNQPASHGATKIEEFKPVATKIVSQKNSVARAVKPQRHNGSTAGIKRLRATSGTGQHVRVRKATTKTTTKAAKQSTNTNGVVRTSTQNNAAVSQNSNIDWERLGFTRPEHSSGRTRARIKAN